MKTRSQYSPLFGFLTVAAAWMLLALLSVFFAGCALVERQALRPVLATNSVPEQRVTNTVYLTNVVVVPSTNGAPVVVQKVVEPVVTVDILPPRVTIVTNGWEVAPSAQAAVGTVATVGNVIQPGAGTLASGVLSGALAILAAWKNRQHKAALTALVTTVRGVEDYRRSVRSRQGDGAGIDDASLPLLIEQQEEAPAPALRLLRDVLAKHTTNTTGKGK